MDVVLTVVDHDKNGFIPLARWRSLGEKQARDFIALVDASVSEDAEPDNKTTSFAFILDLMGGAELADTGTRLLPTQVAMFLAPDQASQWLSERPEPDAVLFRAVPILSALPSLALAEVEDTRDADIALQRLAEIAANPDSVMRGELLEQKLEQWLLE